MQKYLVLTDELILHHPAFYAIPRGAYKRIEGNRICLLFPSFIRLLSSSKAVLDRSLLRDT